MKQRTHWNGSISHGRPPIPEEPGIEGICWHGLRNKREQKAKKWPNNRRIKVDACYSQLAQPRRYRQMKGVASTPGEDTTSEDIHMRGDRQVAAKVLAC
jgi:hypothetical protein